MQKIFLSVLFITGYLYVKSQNNLAPLTVEKIMRNPQWMGSSPSQPEWNRTGDTLYFMWNPEKAPEDSLYFITLKNKKPQKATTQQKHFFKSNTDYVYNLNRTRCVFEINGDIYFTDIQNKKTKRLTQTNEAETNPMFSFEEKKIVYTRARNLYAWDIVSGETEQLTNINTGNTGSTAKSSKGKEEQWLNKDQLTNFEILKERKNKKDQSQTYNKTIPKEKAPRLIEIKEGNLRGLDISPDGRFVSYRTFIPAATKGTIIPDYVTESGYTSDIPGRSKVGAEQGSNNFYIYDRILDSVFTLPVNTIPGITDLPDYLKDYPQLLEKRKKENAIRTVVVYGTSWSPKGNHLVIEIHSTDNKDRWLMQWDLKQNALKLLDRQRDEAWIGGPGINGNNMGWIDENTFWFQSEKTGYSHLYTVNLATLEKKALTTGIYEVQEATLSQNKKYFFITTNEVHPGEKHFYTLNIATGKKERITSMIGANETVLAPNEKNIALLHSYSNKPWELYIQATKAGSKAEQITFEAESEEFKSYSWKNPEVISFKASDGELVYARLYKPTNPHPNKPAILFVHGAGYLQNAHKWWSSYFREYMFNNLLADNGYYVMDIDYRGSAGYGRNWRTGIYRHMGGKDLTDHVDAVKYLIDTYGVNPQHVGLYGGSYGGFITLMALFNQPEVFNSGAALRPVTDWANYNHGYTSNILNEPYNDSLAYYRSSPLYFAKGLKGNLLICHGMVDINVHYQDAVKLTQRLIELGKDNWELAAYPMEDHGFVEPSSWTDEYKKIFKLFETTLKKPSP